MPDVISLCSEGGGQGLQLVVILQALSQSEERWGQQGRDLASFCSGGFLALSGIVDP